MMLETTINSGPHALTRIACGIALACAFTSVAAQTLFTDKTEASLFGNVSGESWGTSVGDFNNDGWIDISILNHRERASFYRNNGDGTLSNVIQTVGTARLLDRFEDHHQSVLSDVDGDGDDDLMYVGNLSGEFRRFWSTGTEFTTSGSQASSGDAWDRLDSCNARTWPALFDNDQDGDVTPILCHNANTFGAVSPSIPQMIDMASEDFDGDLVMDIVALRNSFFISQAKQVSSTNIEALLENGGWGNPSFTFQATGPVTFSVRRGGQFVTSTLSSGSTSFLSNVNASYSSANSTWTVEYISGGWGLTYVEVLAPAGVSNVTLTSSSPSDIPIPPRYYKGLGQGNWQDRTTPAGLNIGLLCAGITAADFDNDMDVDMYVVCRNGAENISNRLYLNNGSGDFSLVANAGGAAGPIGANLFDGAGTGDNAVTADFNNDGFIDIFQINGLSNANLRRGGPHKYFENVGNSNRWINLKLRGNAPNFDAVTAKVIATAGGVAQLRFQDGGLHRYSQDSQRVHFGMGANTATDLEVTWPDGQIDVFANVATNQFYEISQSTGIVAANPGLADLSPLPTVGDDCGTPSFINNLDQALFLYQTSCGSDTWNVRVTAGGESVNYVGQISTTSGSITSATPTGLEGNDLFSFNANTIDFSLFNADSGVDGFTFSMSGEACLELSAGPPGAPIILGSGNGRVDYGGVNPRTLSLCTITPTQTPELSVGDISVNEGAGTVSVPVTLNPAATQTVSVTAFTRAGSATGGSDYFGSTQQLSFPPGSTTRNVTVNIIDDSQAEPTEQFEVRLAGVSGAAIGDVSGNVEIVDNDSSSTVSVSLDSVSVAENAGPARVRVILSGPATVPVIVGVATTPGGTASGGTDFYGKFQSFTFAVGQTEKFFDVTILDDSTAEPNETINIRITGVSGATIGAGTTTATIIDDD